MPKGEKKRKLSDEDRLEIVRRYTTPLPDGTWEGANSLAHAFHVSQQTIYYVLKRADIQRRGAKESHAYGKRCGPIKHTEQLNQPPLCACGCGKHVTWSRSKYRWNKYVTGHYRKDAPYKSREWLHQQYVDNRKSMDEIATECNVNATTIAHALARAGIQSRDASDSKVGRFDGNKNPAWRGGVTPERQRLYKQGRWVEIVKHIYRRDRYTCQRCNSPGKGARKLHAHHIKSWADHPDLRFDASNLITLCRQCHEWVHSKANTHGEYLED